MMRIALILFSIPGLTVRIAASQVACRLLRLPVIHVPEHPFDTLTYAPPPSPMGYALFLSAIAMVNLAVGGLLAFPAAVMTVYLGCNSPSLTALGLLGLSIASEAFPSAEDAAEIHEETERLRGSTFQKSTGSVIMLIVYGLAMSRAILANILVPLGLFRGLAILVVHHVSIAVG